MTLVVVAAIVGSGVVTGLLFAFSNFVMKALADLSDDAGLLAMQRINERIINPIFLLFFLGTPLLCTLIAVDCGFDFDRPGRVALLSGAICYLVGPFGVTILFNVPLNNRLAKTNVSDAGDRWNDYQVRWQRWNHVRTYIGIVSIVLLALGLSKMSLGV
tara:strand:- start:40670 stop:41146 length:477 start_codon:yes stop_codon:yes gene_type:complete